MHFIKAFRLCDKIADNGEDTLKIWEKATGNMYLHKIRQGHRLIKRNKNNRLHNWNGNHTKSKLAISTCDITILYQDRFYQWKVSMTTNDS